MVDDQRDALAAQEESLAERLRGTRLEAIAEGVGALVAAAPWVGGPLSVA